MSEKLNMKEIKKSIYLSFSEDGLIDLAIGLVIFGFATLLMADLPWLVGVFGVVPLLLIYLGKRILTIPRIGIIQPEKKMRRQFSNYLGTMIIAGVGLFTFIIIASRSDINILDKYPLSVFGFVLALGISSLGMLLKTNRFNVYSLLTFVAMIAGEILNKSSESIDYFLMLTIIAGGIILISGLIIIVTFIQKYPKVEL